MYYFSKILLFLLHVQNAIIPFRVRFLRYIFSDDARNKLIKLFIKIFDNSPQYCIKFGHVKSEKHFEP